MVGDELTAESVEKCPRCGTTMRNFSKKYSYSMSRYYCVKCAEALDRDYLARTTCAICGKHLSKSDVKFVMSSKFFGSSGMPLIDRLVCAECHPMIMERMRSRQNAGREYTVKAAVRKSIARSFMHAVKG
ncbi:MAG: hypothetical protein QXR58_02495 [Candidatus Micrarchaeaceae archaeon]